MSRRRIRNKRAMGVAWSSGTKTRLEVWGRGLFLPHVCRNGAGQRPTRTSLLGFCRRENMAAWLGGQDDLAQAISPVDFVEPYCCVTGRIRHIGAGEDTDSLVEFAGRDKYNPGGS